MTVLGKTPATKTAPQAGARARPGLGLVVGYLVNQYPKVSHSFVRREILALERLGVEVQRFSVRRSGETLVDPEDQAEAARTTVLLDLGFVKLARATLGTALAAPGTFMGALRLAQQLGKRSNQGWIRPLAYLVEACALRQALASRSVTHLHAHFGTNSATVALLVRALGGPEFSFTVHGPEEFDRPEAIALGAKVARSAFTLAISSFGRSQIWRHVSFDHWHKVHVVRCGVDGAFAAAEPTPVGPARRLCCVGRLCEQKGQWLLVEAAARLVREGFDFELELVGDGPLRPVLDARIAELGLTKVVRITGWKSSAGVRSAIEQSRALVLPSFAEGLPVVLMEALALGRPVITTAIAGIPELVRAGQCGWLVTAGDLDELVEAMRQALTAPTGKLDRMGHAGRARVLEQHDADGEAQRLLALFASHAPDSGR